MTIPSGGGTTFPSNNDLALHGPARVTGAASIDDYQGTEIAPGAAGLVNPMTTAGDIIVGGVAGAPARLAKGADGTVLQMAAGVQAYGSVPTPIVGASGAGGAGGALSAGAGSGTSGGTAAITGGVGLGTNHAGGQGRVEGGVATGSGTSGSAVVIGGGPSDAGAGLPALFTAAGAATGGVHGRAAIRSEGSRGTDGYPLVGVTGGASGTVGYRNSIHGAGGTGDATGASATVGDAATTAGGQGSVVGGHADTHSDRTGGEINAFPGTAFFGAAEIRSGSTGTPGAGPNFVRVEGNDTDAVRIVSQNGVVFITGLPNADPGVPGRLYHTAGALMVSL